jgi:hypothetical protein
MNRHTVLLSALALTLSLGACSSKNNETADARDRPQAATDGAAPAPNARLDAWQAVGPLLAGSYTGACVSMPDMRKQDGTIVIGADGKASAGDIKVDFRTAKMVLLKRSRDGKGQYSTLASAFVDDAGGGTLSLLSGQDSSANLGRGDIMLACTHVAGATALHARPLYLAVAKVIEGKPATLSCSDPADILKRKDVAIGVSDGVIRIGDATFDMKTAASETLTFADAGGTLMINLEMADKQTIGLAYDGAGTLAIAQAWNKGAVTWACGAKR